MSKAEKHCELGKHKCKECGRVYFKKYRENNRERLNALKREHHKNNREKALARMKKYHENNRERVLKRGAEYRKKRLKYDPIYKLICSIRSRTREVLKNKNIKKNHRTLDFIGCSPAELAAHLESLFQPGMTWENHGLWHVDHRIPISSGKTELEIMQLNHYTNLQPLWASENLSKGAK
jgi:hypothetical protein